MCIFCAYYKSTSKVLNLRLCECNSFHFRAILKTINKDSILCLITTNPFLKGMIWNNETHSMVELHE